MASDKISVLLLLLRGQDTPLIDNQRAPWWMDGIRIWRTPDLVTRRREVVDEAVHGFSGEEEQPIALRDFIDGGRTEGRTTHRQSVPTQRSIS